MDFLLPYLVEAELTFFDMCLIRPAKNVVIRASVIYTTDTSSQMALITIIKYPWLDNVLSMVGSNVFHQVFPGYM